MKPCNDSCTWNGNIENHYTLLPTGNDVYNSFHSRGCQRESKGKALCVALQCKFNLKYSIYIYHSSSECVRESVCVWGGGMGPSVCVQHHMLCAHHPQKLIKLEISRESQPSADTQTTSSSRAFLYETVLSLNFTDWTSRTFLSTSHYCQQPPQRYLPKWKSVVN